MAPPFWAPFLRFRFLSRIWLLIVLGGAFYLIRWSKGAVFLDSFALITRPFWPGTAQSEWLKSADSLGNKAKIILLEEDNRRLRSLLKLDQDLSKSRVSAPVIFRSHKGWWHQIELGKGEAQGMQVGNAVIAPGGLIGRIESITSTTARVRLLTSPLSRIGVWAPRSKQHGILIGVGTNRPVLSLFAKDNALLPGDLVVTSPASTLLPPNLPIGVIKSIDHLAIPSPKAIVQLIAEPEQIDWVQIQVR